MKEIKYSIQGYKIKIKIFNKIFDTGIVKLKEFSALMYDKFKNFKILIGFKLNFPGFMLYYDYPMYVIRINLIFINVGLFFRKKKQPIIKPIFIEAILKISLLLYFINEIFLNK